MKDSQEQQRNPLASLVEGEDGQSSGRPHDNELWATVGGEEGDEEDGLGMGNLEFLERMLREMEDSGVGAAAAADADGDQFVASLRLRLAQEYVLSEEKLDEGARLASLAWQYFERAAPKEDIAGALCLHTLATVKARKGDVEGAVGLLKEALAAARVCRESTLSERRPQRRGAQGQKGQKGGGKGAKGKGRIKAPPQPQPHGSGSLQEMLTQYEGSTEDAPAEGESTRLAAISLEFSCYMMMGELREAEGRLVEAGTLFNAAVNLADSNPHLAETAGRRDAYFGLANILVQLEQFQDALHCAEQCPLGVDKPTEEMDGQAELTDAQLLECGRRIRERRLLASIHIGLGEVPEAAEHMRAVRKLLAAGGASSLDLAAADVATAEVLLCTNRRGNVGNQQGGEEAEMDSLATASTQQLAEGTPQEVTGELLEEVEAIGQWLEEALELLRAAVRVQEQELGADHPALAPTHVAAAEACMQQDLVEEAGGFCDAALRVFEKCEGEDGASMHLPELMAQTAGVLANLGRVEEATGLVFMGAARLVEEQGRERDAVSMMMDFSSLLVSINESDAALTILSALEKKHASALDGLLKGDFLHLKGCAEGESGDFGGAVETLREARRSLHAGKGKEDDDTLLKISVSLVSALANLKKFHEALEVQEDVITIIRKTEGIESPLLQSELGKLKELEEKSVSS